MSPIAIRLAGPGDARALDRLAQRDTQPAPRGPVLLAEVDAVAAAALELRTGRTLADPFRPTAPLVRALAALAPAFAPPRSPGAARPAPLAAARPALGPPAGYARAAKPQPCAR